jgi:hypothetical protein
MGQDRREARDEFEVKLGVRLQDEGLVSAEDLEEAVRQQVIMGGQLATNLWELGLVDGRTLSRLSAEILRVPEANPVEMTELSKDVLNLLPSDFVERNRVFPIGVRRRTLRVATCEPWNHLALGEAAFLSAYPVEPSFVAEVPLMRLLAQHFHIPLGARFRQPLVEHGAAGPVEKPWEEDLPELSGDIATVISVDGKPVEPTLIQPAEPYQEEKPELEPIATLVEAQEALDGADDRDAIGAVLLRFALSRGKRVVLLTHRTGQWTGWLGAGEGIDTFGVRRLMLEAEAGTVFGLVSSTGAHFMGPLKAHAVHQSFLQAIGDEVPSAIALLPVHFRGRLVLGLYLDAGDRRDVTTDLAELLVLAQRVPSALERLIAKRLDKER